MTIKNFSEKTEEIRVTEFGGGEEIKVFGQIIYQCVVERVVDRWPCGRWILFSKKGPKNIF